MYQVYVTTPEPPMLVLNSHTTTVDPACALQCPRGGCRLPQISVEHVILKGSNAPQGSPPRLSHAVCFPRVVLFLLLLAHCSHLPGCYPWRRIRSKPSVFRQANLCLLEVSLGCVTGMSVIPAADELSSLRWLEQRVITTVRIYAGYSDVGKSGAHQHAPFSWRAHRIMELCRHRA